ncbi:MAG: 3-methyladenine DNA glycosylase [Actinomycetota bacterium]|nr:3-methyladenine DNA glycosylase [Actinomycetota bacterium]
MTELLDETVWVRRASTHRDRVDAFCAPHQARRRAGRTHPVWDFLFTYYSLRPRQLRCWHPGFGVVLSGSAARPYLARSGYGAVPAGVAVTAEHLRSRADTAEFVAALLRATAARPARLNCFGLHEWAMVYRSPDTRHDAVPLRLGRAGTDAVVESTSLRCSHFDAFRFFTQAAAGRNVEPLSRERQIETEQPGCLHAAMDLYKWSYKLAPLVASDLVMDCLELAAAARLLDMRASPYDLRGYGFDPIAIETPAGRAEYVRAQQDVAGRAARLRATLAARCDELRTALAEDGDASVHAGFATVTHG